MGLGLILLQRKYGIIRQCRLVKRLFFGCHTVDHLYKVAYIFFLMRYLDE